MWMTPYKLDIQSQKYFIDNKAADLLRNTNRTSIIISWELKLTKTISVYLSAYIYLYIPIYLYK